MLPSIRPPIPAKLIRIAAAFLESGLLFSIGAIFLDGTIQDSKAEGPRPLPLRLGFSILPIVIVALVYAVQRLVKPRRFAFMMAGAIVCALGSALRDGLEPLDRLLDGLRGLVVGAIVMGFVMSIDDEATTLLESGAKPWHEMFFGILLVTFGAMPSAIFGGFVWAVPTIVVGLAVMIRCIRHDAPVVVPRRSMGAAFRIFLSLLFVLLALGFLVVCPMISLGMMRPR